MFEKEAEEIEEEAMKWVKDVFPNDEFKQSGISRALIEFAKLGYNKANEWHYVKDELPDEGTYLVIWQNDKGYKEIFIMHYEEDDEGELHWIDGDCEVQDEYIIAWKEITLPKEIKENE